MERGKKGVGEGGREFGALCSNKCECIYEQVCIKVVFLLGWVCILIFVSHAPAHVCTFNVFTHVFPQLTPPPPLLKSVRGK